MPETYGYVRTRVSDLSGSDPETQRQQLLAAGVELSHIYQDVGVSGPPAPTAGGLGILWTPGWSRETPCRRLSSQSVRPETQRSKRRLSVSSFYLSGI